MCSKIYVHLADLYSGNSGFGNSWTPVNQLEMSRLRHPYVLGLGDIHKWRHFGSTNRLFIWMLSIWSVELPITFSHFRVTLFYYCSSLYGQASNFFQKWHHIWILDSRLRFTLPQEKPFWALGKDILLVYFSRDPPSTHITFHHFLA